jgi:L-fucono-1,5-lactonase
MKIDAHQHFWRFDPARDRWITDNMAKLRRDFLPPDIAPLLAANGIDGVIAVQADQSAAETTFLLDLAARYPIVRGVVGWVDLQAADLADQLARWRAFPRLVGFRHIAQAEPDDFLARPEMAAAVRSFASPGFSYDILVYPRQLAAAETLVARCPEVRFVLDHCGKPPIATGSVAEWQADLARLARHDQVWCKLSGLVTEASWSSWSAADLLPYLDAALALFGPARLLFGSDWPVCLVAAEYSRLTEMIADWVAQFTVAEQAQIWGGNAVTAYRLEH